MNLFTRGPGLKASYVSFKPFDEAAGTINFL